MPQTTSPLNLPLKTCNGTQHVYIQDSAGNYLASTFTDSVGNLERIKAIVHACNTLPKLEEEKARLLQIIKGLIFTHDEENAAHDPEAWEDPHPNPAQLDAIEQAQRGTFIALSHARAILREMGVQP